MALPLLLVGVIIAWWGWKSGAYFRTGFIPGAMILLALFATLLLYAPWPARLRGGARVALIGLTALSVWTLLSALWSPSPDTAISDATRVAIYALSFLLGIWLCLLLGRHMLLALAPLAGAAAALGLLVLIVAWTSNDVGELVDVDATLRYPFGYRNAVAAFFIAGLFPTLVLAASRELDWRLRGALLGSATLSLQLAVLSQSRGSAFAVVVALAVFLAAHPARLRVLAWLALALLPTALALPWLLDVYQQSGSNTPETLPTLRTACSAIAVTTALAVPVGWFAARVDPNVFLSPRTRRVVGGTLLAGLACVAIVGAIAVMQSEGGPGGFLSRHADELTAGTPDLQSQGTRFGLDLGSDRGDLWRVALDDFERNPVAGEGGGGFRFSYLLDRDSGIQPEDPHSVEMLMASELGTPGVLMFAAFVIGAVAAVMRARRLGPSAAVLAAGALGAAAYWLTHASVEWFWSYPALTMPMAFALGAAAAPALLRPAGAPHLTLRRGLVLAAAILALAMVPLFLSERYTKSAARDWRGDLAGAYSDLRRAADLNPFSPIPLAQEAVIAESAGEPQRALGALSEAQERVPDDWTLYYLEARILAEIDPASATRSLERARALNPQGEEISALEEELQGAP